MLVSIKILSILFNVEYKEIMLNYGHLLKKNYILFQKLK
jgi:hypothetical protein